jgi:hypothetical protein
MSTSPPEPKWKKFERLVAALHYTLSPSGATIEWGERIDGREFDVTIRFTQPPYRYLTTIECKDYIVPVGNVEAFVIKARGVKANKAVIVSSVGFQAGAIKVAAEHGIDLYILEESANWPDSLKVISEKPALALSDLALLREGEVVHRFPNGSGPLNYFVHHVMVHESGERHTLNAVVMRERSKWEVDTSAAAQERLVLFETASAEIPFLDPLSITAISFKVQITSALALDTGGLDPAVLPPLFNFRNAITREQQQISATDLWIGFDTEIGADSFYYNPFLGFVYYCVGVTEGVAEYVLVESYQHGSLFQAALTQDIKYGKYFLAVTDESEIRRLHRMLDTFKSTTHTNGPLLPQVLSGRVGTGSVGRNDPCPCRSGQKFKKCHGR